jgi:hypothetical protein
MPDAPGVSPAGHPCERLFGRCSRECFLEWVERVEEDTLVPTAHPRVSPGPGRPLPSRRGYVLKHLYDADKAIVPAGGWSVSQVA